MSLKSLTAEINKKMEKTNPDIVLNPNRVIERIPTGDYICDTVMGGGFPRSRITEIFGMEHSGKTSLLIKCYAGILEAGGQVIHFDFENAWDWDYANKVYGIDPNDENILIYSPDCIEEGGDLFDMLRAKKEIRPDIVSFDSVAAMLPREIIDSKMDESHPAAHARAMATFVPKAEAFAKSRRCAMVFLNQYRYKIQINPYEKTFGMAAGVGAYNKFTTTGGNKLRYAASIRCVLEHKASVVIESENKLSGKSEKIRISNEIMIENLKNKCSRPFLKGATFFDIPGENGQKGGWNEGRALLKILKNKGLVTQSGTKFVYKGGIKFENIGSKAKSEAVFCSRPDLIEDAKNLLGLDNIVDTATKEEIEELEALDIGDDDFSFENAADLRDKVLEDVEIGLDDNEVEEIKEPVEENKKVKLKISKN